MCAATGFEPRSLTTIAQQICRPSMTAANDPRPRGSPAFFWPPGPTSLAPVMTANIEPGSPEPWPDAPATRTVPTMPRTATATAVSQRNLMGPSPGRMLCSTHPQGRRFAYFQRSLDALDQRARAEPAAATHRHEADLLVGALELVQQRRDQAGAGRAERVPERDRAAVHIDAVHVGLQLAPPGRDDRREGLVDLDQIDVVDLHPVAVEQLLRRRDGTGEHDHGVDADGGLVDDPRTRLEAERLRLLALHQQHGGGSVRDLRRVAGGDLAVLLEGGLQLRERLQAGVGPDALIGDVGVAVDGERDDLALEAALLSRLVGELVGPQADLVELGAGDLPLVGDHLGRNALGHQVVVRQEFLGPGRADVVDPLEAHAHRDVAHVLDAGADDGVVHTGRDQSRAEVDRLLRRTALAVDGRGGRLDRQAGLEPGVAADVEHLLAVLLDAAGDDVLDLGRVDPGALDDLCVALAEERVRMGVLVVALLGMAAADRRPRGLDDDYLAPVPILHLDRFLRGRFVVQAYLID